MDRREFLSLAGLPLLAEFRAAGDAWLRAQEKPDDAT